MNLPSSLSICYITNHNIPAERANVIQIMNTCEALSEVGFKVTLFVRRGKFFLDESSKNYAKNVTVYEYFKVKPIFKISYIPVINLRSGNRLCRMIHDRSFYPASVLYMLIYSLLSGRPNVIYVRNLSLAHLLCRLKPLFHALIIYEAHAILQMCLDASVKAKKRESSVFANVNGIVVLTEKMKENLINLGVPSAKICVAPDGVKVENFEFPLISSALRDKLSLPPSAKIIAYVGQLYEWKGVDLILRAYEQVRLKISGVKLLIVGGIKGDFSRDFSRVSQMISNLNLENSVIMTGYLPYRAVHPYILAADILVLPLPRTIQNECFTSPLKLFEYMAAGKPIIASKVGAIQEVIRHESNGVLFEPGNVEELSGSILRLLTDSDLSRAIGEQARVDAASKYTWRHRAERIKKFIEQL